MKPIQLRTLWIVPDIKTAIPAVPEVGMSRVVSMLMKVVFPARLGQEPEDFTFDHRKRDIVDRERLPNLFVRSVTTIALMASSVPLV